jgi:hypothetical protein
MFHVLHRHYMVHAIAVAFWNASYGAARDVAQGRPPRLHRATTAMTAAAAGS